MTDNHLRLALNAYRSLRGTRTRQKKFFDEQSAVNGDSASS